MSALSSSKPVEQHPCNTCGLPTENQDKKCSWCKIQSNQDQGVAGSGVSDEQQQQQKNHAAWVKAGKPVKPMVLNNVGDEQQQQQKNHATWVAAGKPVKPMVLISDEQQQKNYATWVAAGIWNGRGW